MFEKSLSLAAGALLFASVAFSSPLVPLAPATSPDIFTSVGWTFLASTGSVSLTAGTFSGTGRAWVVSDSNNVFGAGKLDFVYQFASNPSSLDPNERITAGTFSGFSVDAGYVSDAGLAPSGVTLSAGGNVVGFDFLPNLAPGGASDLLVVETDATNYVPGTYSVQDSTTASAVGYEPTAAPEPASVALIGVGLLSFSLIRRRRSSKR
jgi:hypothetical protein